MLIRERFLQNIEKCFQRHTILNKLQVRRQFPIVEKKQNKKILSYTNRVQYCGSLLKSMGDDIDGKEMAMTIFNDLSTDYKSLITTLDVKENDKYLFTRETTKSGLLQKELRNKRHNGNSSEAVLIAPSRVQRSKR